MDNENQAPPASTYTPPEEYLASGTDEQNKKIMIGVIMGVVLVIIVTIAFLVYLLTAPLTTTARIRDVFIIFLALQSLLIGVVLIILIVQVAKLTNLLQNEIKPILDSTNETVSNLRGTVAFLSDNLVEPIMKANEYSAGARQLFGNLGFIRRTAKKKDNPKDQ